MKFGVPWSVKGIRPEARETAREAARRSGVSLGDWLNSVILQQAAQGGGHSHDYDDDEDDGSELASVHQRLDDITRKIEQFGRTGPAAYAPKRGRNDEQNQIAALIARLDQRLDQVVNAARPVAPPLVPAMMPQGYPQQAYAPPGYAAPQAYAPQAYAPPQPAPLDRAVAEIAARQRALNGQPQPAPRAMPQAHAPIPAAPPPPPPPVFAPVPAQDLSGLEDQLRKITNQIETLRKPGVEEAINALRAELGEIGNALHEAMPRQAIDTIEHQIAGLSQRIAEGRQAGVDAGALSGLEHGLAEVRDALRGLTPAENLVGFNEAVHDLAHKIDLIVAQKDPATLQQLEHAITTLREMAAHVASDEAVNGIAAQVHMLAERVEQIAVSSGASEALNNLEHRIGALADALEHRSRNGDSVPPMLESLVQSLSDKIERIQQSRGDNVAFDHLEDRIVKLVDRLDASDSRLGHLEAIERGLADLLVQMEDIRAGKGGGGLRAESSPVVSELKHDIARTHDVLDSLRGTLGSVVDRLGAIEQGMRGSERRPRIAADFESAELDRPVGKVAARIVGEQPAPAPIYTQAQIEALAQAAKAQTQARVQAPPQPAPAPVQPAAEAPKRLPRAPALPLNPDLPPDLPLEPGSGAPAIRATPATRIAASQAALGGAAPAAAPEGKSGFIAAARRAAKAAMDATPSVRPSRAAPVAAPAPEPVEPEAFEEFEPAQRASLGGKLKKRVKSLFLAASIVAIVVGSVQIAGNFFDLGSRSPDTKSALSPDTDADDGTDTADITKQPGQPDKLIAAAPAPAPALATPVVPQMPSLLSPPVLSAPEAPKTADVTGAIGRSGATGRTTNQPAPAIQPPKTTASGLPSTIGSPRLRSAALAGDAAAAYEVAVRFAEGRGVPTNLEDAAHWFERAASKGLPPAQFRYASMLEKGQGVKKDLAHARRLYIAAAGSGNAKAMHNLAVLYAEGIDGRPDYATAAQWFRKAALRGVADSQFNLGVLAARGLGTEKNLTDAYKWFALAANQGDRESAKKRDELATYLDAAARAAADQDVKAFAPEPQPPEATIVAEPAGGWEASAAPTSVQGKPRPTSKPLSLGAFEIGKR